MLLLIWVIWGLLLIVTPICLFKVYSSSHNIEYKTFKLVFSFFAYILISVIAFLLGLFFVVGPDPRPNQAIRLESKILCLILILIYGIVSWLLISFVNGKLIRSWRVFSFYEEKPQSIFNSK
jgi:membrane protein YqaA with SNARE-associated domain